VNLVVILLVGLTIILGNDEAITAKFGEITCCNITPVPIEPTFILRFPEATAYLLILF
jgi:hypothetical protein